MRINCIPVEFLTDQHLRAEWVEILMLAPYIRRSIKSKKGLQLYGGKYTLNTNHARFFYDKLAWVEDRYKRIGEDMKSRGYNVNPKLDFSGLPSELFGWWSPSKEDMVVNLNRILTRISLKPSWYSMLGVRSDKFESWVSRYEESFNFKYERKESDEK